MKTRIFPLLAFCGAIAVPGLSARAVEATSPAPPSATATVSVPATAAPEFSGRINDVVSLAKSGVDESVVLSFINASPGPFQPSADEIIKLRDEGISSPVISAMLQRGGELREQATAAAAASAQTAAQAPVITADQSGAGSQTVASEAPVETPPVTYASGDSGSSVVYIGGSQYPVYYPWYNGFVSTAFFFPSPCWFNGRFFPHGCFFPRGGFIHGHGGFVARGGFNGGFHNGFHGGFVARGNNGFVAGGRNGFVAGGFRGNSGFHSFNPGFRSSAGFPGFRSFNSGFSAAPVGSGFHGPVAGGGFHGSMGGFHGGGSVGGFHGGMGGGGFHGGMGGGGFHGGGGGGFHGGGGGMGGGHR